MIMATPAELLGGLNKVELAELIRLLEQLRNSNDPPSTPQ